MTLNFYYTYIDEMRKKISDKPKAKTNLNNW
jgi:hypothetical protein